MHGIQFAYITCCYVRQASGKLSGCLEQPLFERYAYIFNTLPKRSIGALSRQTQHVAKFQ